MVTTPAQPGNDPTTREKLLADVEAASRTVIAGSSVGAIRRIVLYLITGVALIGATIWAWALVPGIVALMLLLATDDLR